MIIVVHSEYVPEQHRIRVSNVYDEDSLTDLPKDGNLYVSHIDFDQENTYLAYDSKWTDMATHRNTIRFYKTLFEIPQDVMSNYEIGNYFIKKYNYNGPKSPFSRFYIHD